VTLTRWIADNAAHLERHCPYHCQFANGWLIIHPVRHVVLHAAQTQRVHQPFPVFYTMVDELRQRFVGCPHEHMSPLAHGRHPRLMQNDVEAYAVQPLRRPIGSREAVLVGASARNVGPDGRTSPRSASGPEVRVGDIGPPIAVLADGLREQFKVVLLGDDHKQRARAAWVGRDSTDGGGPRQL
jgi:hypothetical protein